MSGDDLLVPIAAELAASAIAGRRIEWWWRDDDAVADTRQLRRLLATSDKFGMPVLLAAIPALCEPSLAEAVRGAPLVSVAQHGFAHANHEPSGQAKSEFGVTRPLATIYCDIADGRDRLRALFGNAAQPVFVPPWNSLRREAWMLLPELGMRGLSAYGARGSAQAAPGVPLANTHLDILDWGANPVTLASPEELVRGFAAELRRRRERAGDGAEPIGILTHHRAMDDAAWAFVERLFALCTAYSSCRSPLDLFGLSRAA